MNTIPVIDILFLILIVLMIIRGYVRGFVKEVFTWASLLLSAWAAVLLHPAGAEFIRGRIMEDVEHIPEILAFIALFLIVMILVKMLEHILKDVIMGLRLGGADKVLGALFGFIEGLTLTALLFFVLNIQPLFDAESIIKDSTLAQILLPLIRVPIERGMDMINTTFLFLQAA